MEVRVALRGLVIRAAASHWRWAVAARGQKISVRDTMVKGCEERVGNKAVESEGTRERSQ